MINYILKAGILIVLLGTAFKILNTEYSQVISIIGLGVLIISYPFRYINKNDNNNQNLSKLVLIESFCVFGIVFFLGLVPDPVYGAILILPFYFFKQNNDYKNIWNKYFVQSSILLKTLLILATTALIASRYLEKFEIMDASIITIMGLGLAVLWVLLSDLFNDQSIN